MKKLGFDSFDQSTCLATTDISQACAKQRAGRAGRVRDGFCYRLYSKEQFEKMDEYTQPEMLCSPLTEICLNAKILAGDSSIEEYLMKAVLPPPVKNIRRSIELLKKIGALDDDENITNMGTRVVGSTKNSYVFLFGNNCFFILFQ